MDFASVWDGIMSMWPLVDTKGESPLTLQANVNPIIVPASGQITATIDLPGDCNIQIDDWVAFSTGEGFPGVMGFRCTIYYGNDWALTYPTNNPVRGENIFGTAQRPGRIGYRPWFIQTRGNRGLLQFNFTNLQTTTITVEITLRGHRER